MSHLSISAAFEKKLALLTPTLATAYENADYKPVTGTPYQRVKLLPTLPDNSVIASDYYRELGLFEIVLFYPLNAGSGAAKSRANAIKTHFKRGTAMTEDGLIVKVNRTPNVSQGFKTDDRYAIPITISYYTEKF